MDTLTQKQKDNRKYHARHAEKIRAKKRQQYQDSKPKREKKFVSGRPLKIRPEHKPSAVIRITAEEKAQTETRRKIEDILIAREIEMDSFDE